MGNLGAGEFLRAYLIKETVIDTIDSQIKESILSQGTAIIEGVTPFRYRYLTNSEMTSQPITGWLKGQFKKVIYTSQTNIEFKERDIVLCEDDGRKFIIDNIMKQTHIGMFLLNKKSPHILELK